MRPDRPALDALDRRLLDEHQRGFPVCEAPFAEIARALGCEAGEVLRRLADLRRCGVVSRVGPVFAPGRIGASTLAAMAVPPERLASVAACVNRYRAVNHNYEREHEINLWFVLAAPDAEEVEATLAGIRRRTGLEVLDLRLERAYHIDLGFPLWCRPSRDGSRPPAGRAAVPAAPESSLAESDRSLVGAIQDGLPLTARPYAAVAARIGLTETQVMGRIRQLLGDGVIKRLGVVVRHRELGYRANAMVVFDVVPAQVDAAGERLAALAPVTLCYRRTRRPPVWPYNLYCMLHGRNRDEVMDWVHGLLPEAAGQRPGAVLFSRRRFRQRGARYAPDHAPAGPETEVRGAAG